MTGFQEMDGSCRERAGLLTKDVGIGKLRSYEGGYGLVSCARYACCLPRATVIVVHFQVSDTGVAPGRFQPNHVLSLRRNHACSFYTSTASVFQDRGGLAVAALRGIRSLM